jgi:hypothetical protein
MFLITYRHREFGDKPSRRPPCSCAEARFGSLRRGAKAAPHFAVTGKRHKLPNQPSPNDPPLCPASGLGGDDATHIAMVRYLTLGAVRGGLASLLVPGEAPRKCRGGQ